MTLKRPLSPFHSSGSSSPPRGPSKRRQISLTYPFPLPSSPVINTPEPPHRRHYPVPFDSPNNPFGRKYSVNLALPQTTSFRKHLPLRFQLIREGVGGQDRDGIYRIVQVPLNYTFRHLHKLLLFLFGGHPVSVAPGISKTLPPRRSTRLRNPSGKGKIVERENQGHIFEVQKHVSMFNEPHKLGQIRSAKTRVKLSSVRDPYRYRGEDDFAGYGVGGGAEISEADAEGEDAEWRWEAEEDFTVSHVWPEGGDLTRGVIYHHDSHTQIHITVNDTVLPPRKGVGNKPFVFRARGLVHLYSDNEQETKEDRPEAALIPDKWNTHVAFDGFLKLSNARERAKREEDSDMDRDRGGISMYPAMSDASDLSGISDLTTPGLESSKSESTFSLSSSPFLFTPITPFPKHPVHALRVEHAHRQMAKLSKKGMAELSESDEDEEGEEVDELAGDAAGDEDEEVDELEDYDAEHNMAGGRLEIRRGLGWDPFGDEAEL